MALHHSPRIVTDGLVLCLDAANPKSYPGSGTTWFDLSGNGNDGSLVGGVGFDSGNGGALVFDGVNDEIVLGNIEDLDFPGNFTVSFFTKQNSSVTQVNARVISNGSYDQYGYEVFVDTTHAELRTYNPSDYSSHSVSTNTSNWKYYSFVKESSTISKIHILPDNIISTGSASNCVYNNHSFTIGVRSTNPSYRYGGDLSLLQCYDRALSASEIQQNFQALRGRYGL